MVDRLPVTGLESVSVCTPRPYSTNPRNREDKERGSQDDEHADRYEEDRRGEPDEVLARHCDKKKRDRQAHRECKAHNDDQTGGTVTSRPDSDQRTCRRLSHGSSYAPHSLMQGTELSNR